MPAWDRLRFNSLHAVPHHTTRWTIQVQANSCWPSAVAGSQAGKPRRRTIATIDAVASPVSHPIAANPQQTGRGSKEKRAGQRSLRAHPRAARITAGRPPVVLRARRAAFLKARAPPGGAGRARARQLSSMIPVIRSTAGNAKAEAPAAPAAAATGCPVATAAASTAAAADHPPAVTTAAAANSSDAVGPASQDTRRRGRACGIGAAGSHGSAVTQFQLVGGGSPPGGTHPADGPPALTAATLTPAVA